MKKYISLFHKSVTAKGTVFLLSGSVLSNLIGFLVVAILTRNLGPSAFGLFITGFTFSQLLTDLFELGINPAMLAFASGLQGKERQDYLKTAFILKCLVGILLLGSIFFGAPLIGRFVFKSNEIIPYIQISALGSILMIFVVWGQTVFNSENKFLLSSIINSSTNVFRLLLIVLLVILNSLSPVLSFLLFQISIIFSLIFFFLLFGFEFLKGSYKSYIAKKMIIFGLPIGFSFSLGAIYSRLDQIIVFNLLGSYEAGVYGLAYRLASVFILGISAFGSVISPRFASIEESQFPHYFKKTVLVILGLAACAFVSVIISPYAIPLIFGSSYINTVTIYQILTFGVILFILQIPFSTAIVFRYKYSKFLIPFSIISLGMMYLFLNYLIPRFQANGAAWAFTFLNMCQLIFYITYFEYLKRNRTR